MSTEMTIGEFARVTHLSAKALRHYHDLGLLEPRIDPANGYRRYHVDQAPTAHLIRRLRDLDMPLAEVRAVVEADGPGRERAVLAHLRRMETELERTRQVVASLREMLAQEVRALDVEHRTVGATPVLAVTERVGRHGIETWFADAFADLGSTVEALGGAVAGAPGALYGDDWFIDDEGDVTAFMPIDQVDEMSRRRPRGRVRVDVLPPAHLAVAVHRGTYHDMDRTYGALGAHVASSGAGAPGPVREHYLVSYGDADDVESFVTEICWPVVSVAS